MPSTEPAPVIGLIGGIGSGKSLVASLFARHGAQVIVGDSLGHEALRQPEIRAQVARRWGARILDEQGEVDRRLLGQIVFADPEALRQLEALVLPYIERRIAEEIAAARADPTVPLILLDAAILLEAGWDRFCDRIVFVDTPRETRLRRLAEQRGWNAKEVEAREKAQLSLTEKASRAHDTLPNTGSPEDTAGQVEGLLRRWGQRP